MKPNILFIFSDQHRHDCAGYAGHPLVKTPNLDRLAREGLVFTHAGCNTPVSAPARQSLLTGLWPVEHGGIALFNLSESRAHAPLSLEFFPRLLKRAGYVSAHAGKWHVAPGYKPQDVGFDEFLNVPPEKNHAGLPPRDSLPPCLPHPVAGAPEEHQSARVTALTREFIRAQAGRDRPFFAMLNFEEPHPPYHTPEPYASMYDPAAIEPWPNFADDLAGKPRQQRQMRRTWELDGKPWRGYWDRQAAGYFGSVSMIDRRVGTLLDALEEDGIAGETLVVYSTDHGDMTGAHGLFDKHCNLYDEIVRVPLLARWPGTIAPGRRYDGFASNVLDLAATFADLATGAVPAKFQGRSLLPILKGQDDDSPCRRRLLATYHGGQFGMYSQRMYRDKDWKLVWNPTDLDELYDLRADPHEGRNLAEDPAHATKLAEMRAKLYAAFLELRDPLMKTHWVRRMLMEGGSI